MNTHPPIRQVVVDASGAWEPSVRDPDPEGTRRRYQDALAAPKIFLSASVPVKGRDERDWVPSHVWGSFDYDRLAKVLDEDPLPTNIHRAVVWISRAALLEGYTLVFGGHPAISPMVLDMAGRELPPGDDLRVLVFQSRVFESSLTKEAQDLGRWSRGCMVLTDPAGDPSDAADRVRGLTAMRRRMIELPCLRAAVFVGGMSGCLEESLLCSDPSLHPNLPRYAVGATGGAARFLYEQRTDHHGSGERRLVDALKDAASYGALATRIVHDIDPGPSSTG